jgi:hypothetical protein
MARRRHPTGMADPPATGSVRPPSLGKALLVVVVSFFLVVGIFLISGIFVTWGLFLLPVLAAASALYLVWSTRRKPPPADAGTAAP